VYVCARARACAGYREDVLVLKADNVLTANQWARAMGASSKCQSITPQALSALTVAADVPVTPSPENQAETILLVSQSQLQTFYMIHDPLKTPDEVEAILNHYWLVLHFGTFFGAPCNTLFHIFGSGRHDELCRDLRDKYGVSPSTEADDDELVTAPAVILPNQLLEFYATHNPSKTEEDVKAILEHYR
jgi:hypothetical protein